MSGVSVILSVGGTGIFPRSENSSVSNEVVWKGGAFVNCSLHLVDDMQHPARSTKVSAMDRP